MVWLVGPNGADRQSLILCLNSLSLSFPKGNWKQDYRSCLPMTSISTGLDLDIWRIFQGLFYVFISVYNRKN